MKNILGLDLGPNSIGWALIDDEAKHIIDMGSRVFEAGINQLETKKEQSKNATRREKRFIRRITYRRKRRKKALLKAMRSMGFIDGDDISEHIGKNPYELRKNALDKMLTKGEIARALYHICQRRGFKSNRIADDEKESNTLFKGKPADGKVGINELRQEIKAGGHRTLGEYLASVDPHEIRIRNRYTHREMYLEEFDLIWESQKKYYPDLMTDDNRKVIRDKILFYQRPLKSQKSKLGKCQFEKGKPRCHRSAPWYQEFRMLQQVNSLRIYGGTRLMEENAELSEDERQSLVDYLSDHKEMKLQNNKDVKKDLSTLKKTLGLDKEVRYKINLSSFNKLDGLNTLGMIKNSIGKDKYESMKESEIYDMWHCLVFYTDKGMLKEHAMEKWKLSEIQAEKYAKIKLEQGYSRLSTKAIKKILPYLREGYLYSEACEKAGYDHSLLSVEVKKEEMLDIPKPVANPVVMATLYELRKVVNAIIERYGKPDVIKVELARSMKQTSEQRKEVTTRNKERDARHKKIVEDLKENFGIAQPSRDDIIKYKLWEECNKICPYTGRSISEDQLFNTKEVEVEHILPFSRTLDNSYMNKTLCFKTENNIKSNKTPYEAYYEAYSKNSEHYAEIVERAKKLPHNKYKKFILKNLKPKEEFISSQLNDTAYISRVAKEYLMPITKEVIVTNGQQTSFLRRLWGLNSVLYEDLIGDIDKHDVKNRDDHRHHAVDAAVIANISRSFIQKLSTYRSAFGHLRKLDEKDFPMPWDGFRQDVLDHVGNIIVSHKFKKRLRGQLHKEHFYGLLHDHSNMPRVNEENNNLYAKRKDVEDLSKDDILNIVDPIVRDVVCKRLLEFGIKPGSKTKLTKDIFADPLYMPPNKNGQIIPIKKVRIQTPMGNAVQIKDYNIWANPRNNHHVVIYVDENGKQKGEVVTLYEATKRKNIGQPVIKKDIGHNNEFVVSLMRNEMVMDGSIPDDFDIYDKNTYHNVFMQIYRVQKMSIDEVTLRMHHSGISQTSKSYDLIRTSPKKLNVRKLRVDPIGFLEWHDE